MSLLQSAFEISVRVLALAAIAGLGLWIFRVRSASVKHAVWMMVLSGMLMGALLAPLLPAIPWRVLRAAPVVVPMTSLPFTPVFRRAPEATVRRVDSQVWVGGLYGLITIALLTRLALGYRGMRRLVRESVAVRGETIRESADVVVPMTAGMRRPVILLPRTWREWPSEKLDAVLAHEQAHIYRRDWAVMLIARINRSVFWFHPLAWWLKRELAVLAEEACDDAAVARIGDRVVYAQALLEIAGGVQTGRMLQEGIAMARTANVERRIDRALDESRKLSRALGHAAAAAFAVIGAPVLYLTWTVQLAPAQATAQAQTRQAKPPAPPTPPLDGPWQRWLTQEVVYIINAEERAAFLRLNTDAERAHFSEQFWARRDPTPGTGANKFQDEHYRRIAYSNERFAAAAPGWQTDRGRIYIVFGPPDEIESHPSAGQGPDGPTMPFEKWLYRHVEGIGDRVILTFTDDEANREIRLSAATGPPGAFGPVKQRP